MFEKRTTVRYRVKRQPRPATATGCKISGREQYHLIEVGEHLAGRCVHCEARVYVCVRVCVCVCVCVCVWMRGYMGIIVRAALQRAQRRKAEVPRCSLVVQRVRSAPWRQFPLRTHL